MRTRLGSALVAVATALVVWVGIGAFPVSGQAQATGVPRTKEGKPDFSGVWQTMTAANWDIQTHAARSGPIVALGAAFSVQGGMGIVEGNDIPYRPEALAKKKENGDNWLTRDPEVKCFMPGVPRATYMPYPFQIVQGSSTILIGYEFASASRTIRMNTKEKSPTETWMGWSNGRWEGDTLAVDVTDLNDQTWFDRAGNHHSAALKVVERYTMTGPNMINYEATMDDPKTFTRPWKISLPVYRRMDKNAQLMEYKCVPFAEELMYGHLRKRPTAR